MSEPKIIFNSGRRDGKRYCAIIRGITLSTFRGDVELVKIYGFGKTSSAAAGNLKRALKIFRAHGKLGIRDSIGCVQKTQNSGIRFPVLGSGGGMLQSQRE